MNIFARIWEALHSLPWLRVIIAPLLGAVIGYITNDLALKMLFRPYEEKYIGKFHIPFTPGLIPQQKSRIAHALGGVIANKLLDADTLRQVALSDETIEKLRCAITRFLTAQAEDEQPLRLRLEVHVPHEQINHWQEKLTNGFSDFIMDKLREAQLGTMLADQVMASIRRRLERIPMAQLLEGAIEPLRGVIAATVERKLAQLGPGLIHSKLLETENEFLAASMAQLTDGRRERIPEITDRLLSLYRELFDNNIETFLQAVHLDEIITRRIESFDARELEKVVFGVAKREIRAIVYLGAALGFMMGFINLLF